MQQQALQMTVASWAQRDPAAALAWTMSNADVLSNGTVRQVAQQLTRDDPELAMQYVDRVPADARDAWISSVAGSYATFDRQRAVDWVGQYRGQTAYAPAVMAVVESTAEQDPRAAANLLDGLGPLPEGSDSAVRSVVNSWASRDAVAARNWTMQLPRGQARDMALTTLISTDRNAEIPDTEILAAFSSDLARQQGILRVIYNVARNDPLEAQRLVDTQISSPAVRQQAEQYIERISR